MYSTLSSEVLDIANRSNVQMADQPYDCDRQRRQKEQKDDPTFPSVFAKPAGPSNAAAWIERLCTLQRYGNVQALLRLLPCRAALVSQRLGIVFCSVCNDPFEPFQFLTQLRFLSRDVLLPAAQRRSRSARRAKHPHHLLAIHKKRASAMTPNRISGKESAMPIWNH